MAIGDRKKNGKKYPTDCHLRRLIGFLQVDAYPILRLLPKKKTVKRVTRTRFYA